MITQRFAVELDRRMVGIAVRLTGGFVFYSADAEFWHLDGYTFRTARALERGVRRAARRHRRAPSLGRATMPA